jgi:hypothetical protein
MGHRRQSQVHQGQVRLGSQPAQPIDALAPAGTSDDVELGRQQVAQGIGDQRIVVDDQQQRPLRTVAGR